MLLFTRKSRQWRNATALAAVGLVVLYGWDASRGFPHGGSPLGIALGVLATVLFLILLFLGIRKRAHRLRWGTLEGWTQAHLYLGLLMLLVVALHSGFRFEDRVALAAFLLTAAVVLTGVVGAVLYTTVPLLLTGTERELSPEEMSREINQLAASVAQLARQGSPALQEVARQLLAVHRLPRLAGWRLLFRGPRRPPTEEAPWTARLREVPPSEHRALQTMLVQGRQLQELQANLESQMRYRNLLVAWLWLHVPLSIALVVAVAAHLVGVWYYAGVF